MSVAVKTPRTDFRVSGDVPRWLMRELKKRYGEKARVERRGGEKLENVLDTSWFRKLEAEATPGKNLRLYRLNRSMSQAEVASMLGPRMRKQHVSNLETGIRPISKKLAKKLAYIFGCPVGRFI